MFSCTCKQMLTRNVCIAAQAQAKAVPVTMNEMLLRGCTLKNTGHILGLAVYTGNETRIQKNSAKTPNKIGEPSNHSCLMLSALKVMQVSHSTALKYCCQQSFPHWHY